MAKTAIAPPVPKPAKVPISECLGKRIVCHICGAVAQVDHARGARTNTQVISSRFWVLVKCKGQCGSMLCKVNTQVELQPEPTPEVVVRPLGQVVGHYVLCPREGCASKSRAAWDIDQGHTIECPVCQTHAYNSETLVEVVAGA